MMLFFYSWKVVLRGVQDIFAGRKQPETSSCFYFNNLHHTRTLRMFFPRSRIRSFYILSFYFIFFINYININILNIIPIDIITKNARMTFHDVFQSKNHPAEVTLCAL